VALIEYLVTYSILSDDNTWLLWTHSQVTRISDQPPKLSKQVTSPGQNVGETDLDNVTHDFNRVLMSMVFK